MEREGSALKRICTAWSLTPDGTVPLAQTTASTVWRVKTAEGELRALKIWRGGQATPNASAQPRLLAAWGGRGAVRVYRWDASAILMDWLNGPTAADVAAEQGLYAADRIVARAAAALTVVDRVDVMPVFTARQACDTLLRLSITALPRAARAHFQAACRAAGYLLDAPGRKWVLHGDLHHGNVMKGRDGWRAIDPNPVWAPPAYAFGNVFRNPYGVPGRIEATRLRRLTMLGASALNTSPRLILNWAFVRTAQSIAWTIEDGAAPPPTDLCLLRQLFDLAPLPRAQRTST